MNWDQVIIAVELTAKFKQWWIATRRRRQAKTGKWYPIDNRALREAWLMSGEPSNDPKTASAT